MKTPKKSIDFSLFFVNIFHTAPKKRTENTPHKTFLSRLTNRAHVLYNGINIRDTLK